jgi:type II secretory pathway pseudopilin PulG
MLNKKGFTIAEVIVSFSLISIILASLISATMFYRDKVKSEEVSTQLLDFKNTITKIVYDDIIYKNIARAESCIGVGVDEGVGNCVKLIDKNEVSHVLKIEEVNSGNDQGVFLLYDGKRYKLPDSDLSSTYVLENGTTGIERICEFVGGFEVSTYNNKIYKVKATFLHKDLGISHDLLFVIS